MSVLDLLVVSPSGKRLHLRRVAASLSEAQTQVEDEGFFVVTGAVAERRTYAGARKQEMLAAVMNALASLLAAGLPLRDALTTAQEVVDRRLIVVLDDITEQVERGESLSVAMQRHPDLFPSKVTVAIGAAETGGALAEVLADLGRECERSATVQRQLYAAATYPVILATASTCSVLFLVTSVLPQLAGVLASTQSAMPAMAGALLRVAAGLRAALPLALPLTAAVALIVAARWNSMSLVRWRERIFGGIPVVGTILRERATAEVARTLAVMLKGGVPLAVALTAMEEPGLGPSTANALARIRRRVSEGESLSIALTKEPTFVPLAARLVSIGERSGRLPEHLRKLAEYCDEAATQRSRKAITLIEPALILFFGVIVGMIATAVMQVVYGVSAGAVR